MHNVRLHCAMASGKTEAIACATMRKKNLSSINPWVQHHEISVPRGFLAYVEQRNPGQPGFCRP